MLNDSSNYIIFLKRSDFSSVKRQSITTPQNWPYKHITTAESAAHIFNKANEGSIGAFATPGENRQKKAQEQIKRLPLGIKVFRKQYLNTQNQLPSTPKLRTSGIEKNHSGADLASKGRNIGNESSRVPVSLDNVPALKEKHGTHQKRTTARK